MGPLGLDLGVQQPLIYFHKYGALRVLTLYCFQNLGPYPQLYSRKCNNEGKMRTKMPEIGRRCDSCEMILKSSINNIKKIVCKQGETYHRAETISFLPILTELDVTSIKNFSKTCLTDLSKTGQLLRSRLVNSLHFYTELKKMKKRQNQNQTADLLSLPGTDCFIINKFIAM
jgi:hypothetical protein